MYMGKRSKLLCLYDGPNVNNPCQNRLLDCLAGYDDLAHSLAGIDSFPVNQSFLRIAPTRKHTLMGRLPFGLATEDCYGYPQKPIEWNGLKIELIGAEIVDGEAFLQEYNIDRESIFSDSLSEKYALFHISVTKVSDSPLLTYYRFDYCGAEKDGWRNLVSPEIFESLNPLAKKPSQLSVGETEELAMAIGLHKDAFRNTEWSNLSTSDISLVMSVYPQKVILQSS